MVKLRHFSKDTDPRLFFCSHTGDQGIKDEFLLRLDELRHRCGFPFVISSGYRSPDHPKEASKRTPGTHAQGIAADITALNGFQKRKILDEAVGMGFGGIGVGKTFVHVDDREGTKVLWEYS